LILTFKVVDQDTDCFKSEKVGQILLHLLEKTIVVPLRANLRCELKSVHNGFLSEFNLSLGQSTLKSELQVVTENLKDLLIRYLEAFILIGFLIESGFTLNCHDDLIILMHVYNRLNHVLIAKFI